MYTYKIILHKELEGGFTITVPTLPGCITYGEDVYESITKANKAIELYIEALRERGEAIPDDSNTIELSSEFDYRMHLNLNPHALTPVSSLQDLGGGCDVFLSVKTYG